MCLPPKRKATPPPPTNSNSPQNTNSSHQLTTTPQTTIPANSNTPTPPKLTTTSHPSIQALWEDPEIRKLTLLYRDKSLGHDDTKPILPVAVRPSVWLSRCRSVKDQARAARQASHAERGEIRLTQLHVGSHVCLSFCMHVWIPARACAHSCT